jgi:transposase
MRQYAMEEARRKLQMKYKKEAEAAAKKKKEVSNNWLHVLQFLNM